MAELSALRRVSDTKSILKKERALYGSVQTEIPVQCFHIDAPLQEVSTGREESLNQWEPRGKSCTPLHS